MSHLVHLPTGRRLALIGGVSWLLAACADRPTPPPSPASGAPPMQPAEPILQTTLDGRPVIAFAGLRYSVRPPLGWRLKPLAARDPENRPDDVVALAAPQANVDPVAADTQITLEAFRKSERAPTFDAKLDNIAADRRRQRADFKIERELPLALADGKRAHLFRMSNLPSGDSEAVAFIDEGQVVAEMVLVSRTRPAFDATMPLFREMVRTYQRIG